MRNSLLSCAVVVIFRDFLNFLTAFNRFQRFLIFSVCFPFHLFLAFDVVNVNVNVNVQYISTRESCNKELRRLRHEGCLQQIYRTVLISAR